MRQAIALARRGLGKTWPNPTVGCIIVQNDRVIGRGRTGEGGRPHAESVAIHNTHSKIQGATAYVSLEPCAHFGQTPPCANQLIEAGISRAVIAIDDPDPRVAGKGIELLKSGGVNVSVGVLGTEASEVNLGFLSRITKNLPAVSLKLALSLDGKIATCMNDSKWITHEDARRRAHLLRSQHDAIMVGYGTASIDNPDLSPRYIGCEQPPVRVVLDTTLKTPFSSKIGRAAKNCPVWMCHGEEATQSAIKAWQRTGAQTIPCKLVGGRVNIRDALSKLADRGITRVLCEGGSQIATSLLRDNLVDDIVCFTAGLNIGNEGLSSVGHLEIRKISKAPRFRLKTTYPIGQDILHHWRRVEN